MKPPMVYDDTSPSSQRMMRMTAIVHNILDLPESETTQPLPSSEGNCRACARSAVRARGAAWL
jgi:hypothetical protein